MGRISSSSTGLLDVKCSLPYHGPRSGWTLDQLSGTSRHAMEQGQLSDPHTWPDRYGNYLFRSALTRVRDRVLAEEIVQETFLAALQARARFSGQSSERTWLVGIMKHKIIDQFRKQSREYHTEDIDSLGEGPKRDRAFDEAGHWRLPDQGPREWANPAAAIEQKEFWTVLRQCLGELPPRFAQAFTLREVDDLSSQEVCQALKVSSGNLWVILHRARKHLRACLEMHHFS
ncbi:MAG: sigma-70 family RNA polymerase sigma factor [Nitrospiraceae bacterium]